MRDGAIGGDRPAFQPLRLLSQLLSDGSGGVSDFCDGGSKFVTTNAEMLYPILDLLFIRRIDFAAVGCGSRDKIRHFEPPAGGFGGVRTSGIRRRT